MGPLWLIPANQELGSDGVELVVQFIVPHIAYALYVPVVHLYRYPEDDSRLLVHDYIRSELPYLDLVHERHPNDFYTTTGERARIDYVYCTRPLLDCVVEDRIVSDEYTTPVRNPQNISNFWHPSDHRPIIVDFSL